MNGQYPFPKSVGLGVVQCDYIIKAQLGDSTAKILLSQILVKYITTFG